MRGPGRGRRRNPYLFVDHGDELKIFRTSWARLGLLLMVALYVAVPHLTDDFALSILNAAGVAAIGAIGLNLLTGYTGQVSLGHAFFLATGAYVAANLGVEQGLPLALWLPAAALAGAVVGIVIGPFALRLRGNYLAIVTLGLVFFGLHLWNNWSSVTGGPGGISTDAPLRIGPLDFEELEVFGSRYTDDQGLFWLIWAIVVLSALLATNVVRSRPGRAMQAVRDRDLAAEVIGVSLLRCKLGAFAVSSALAAVAGGLYGAALQNYVNPEEWTLFLSIQYIGIIIVGGVGTVVGPVLGALVLGSVPPLIDEYAGSLPLIGGGDPVLSAASAKIMIFGLLIMVFLLVEPRGLAAVWLRVKTYFQTWPFSY